MGGLIVNPNDIFKRGFNDLVVEAMRVGYRGSPVPRVELHASGCILGVCCTVTPGPARLGGLTTGEMLMRERGADVFVVVLNGERRCSASCWGIDALVWGRTEPSGWRRFACSHEFHREGFGKHYLQPSRLLDDDTMTNPCMIHTCWAFGSSGFTGVDCR